MRNQLVTQFRSAPDRARPPAVDPFHAVADPTRRAILDRLRRGEAPVTELASGFAISRPAVSKHLRVLRDARLVHERRGGADGRQRIYSITPEPLGEVAAWVQGYDDFWPANLESLKRHLESRPKRAAGSGTTELTMEDPES
jgi:DNA-binding transcriptional ArsR family regulator